MTGPPSLPDRLLTRPLADLSLWTTHFCKADIPVLEETAVALEAFRNNEDDADANSIGEMISNDPLMTLKVLAFASTQRGRTVVTNAETVTAALVMMGISPFFRTFGEQPVVDARLAHQPEALEGLRAAVRRAHRRANFALGFAVHRMDPNAAVMHAVALLHEFVELLLWCEAPALALQIQSAQRADTTLRSRTAQLQFLNIDLLDLQRALIQAWRLPELLSHLGDAKHAQNTSVRSIELAARLARHTAQGWSNAAIPDDIHEIAALLNISPAATLHLVEQI